MAILLEPILWLVGGASIGWAGHKTENTLLTDVGFASVAGIASILLYKHLVK